MRFLHILAVLLCAYQVRAKAVFAHLLVGNVKGWGISQWEDAIRTAANLKIDAFALNMAFGDDSISTSISYAFQAANAMISEGIDFYLFFSFDYTGGTGPWPATDVSSYLGAYTPNGAYYHDPDNNLAFVSTFQGIDNILDWPDLISQYSLEFVPCWSSLGAIDAWSYGVADGLFSWAAWPWGNTNTNSFSDASYIQVLGNQSLSTSAPYMMGVSPMFYTNLPGYDKNWLWRGDSLWFDRWQEVLFIQPKFVEIITWNDWGESHYIGPLDSTQYDTVFPHGDATYNFVEGYPHDGWRALLPVFIDLYKQGTSSFSSEILVAWSRTSPAVVSGCSTNYTTGNTASQLQLEFTPEEVVQDYIFFAALLGSEVDPPEVNIGPNIVPSYWTTLPATYPGLAFGNASFSGYTGDWFVVVTRDEGMIEILLVTGGSISDACEDNVMNYNMWVGNATNPYGETVTASVKDYVCTAGTSVASFAGLCEFTCSLGYCPLGACYCTEQGPQNKLPTPVSTLCYPLEGISVTYEGLCSFACTYGYYDATYCGLVDYSPYPVPTISAFNEPYCTGGSGEGDFADMCEWACKYSYCPIAVCTCTSTSIDLLLFDGDIDTNLKANYTANPLMPFNDICTWTCSRGYCDSVCETIQITGCASGTGSGNYGGLCSFSCGRGYCPEPCTCDATGVVEEVQVDPDIVGYAAAGTDETTYGPLCNFTCPRGYCPSPDACISSFIGNTTLTSLPPLPTLADYNPENLTAVNYTSGDFFMYESDEDPDLFVDVLFVGNPTPLPSRVCDDVTPGSEGGTLGCVGETIEWLMLSYLEDPTETKDAEARSLSKYTFNVNKEWSPQSNCSRNCQLLANAPLNSWVHVGNGTHNGRLHNLHFMNTGKSLAYKAVPRSLATTALDERFFPLLVFAAVAVVSIAAEAWMLESTKKAIIARPIAVNAAEAAMESALDNYLTTCTYTYSNNTDYMPASASPLAMGISIGDVVGPGIDLSSGDADSLSTTCLDGSDPLEKYVIWPVDGLDVDTIQNLLASLPLASPIEQVSVTGGGTIYWKAYLTIPQTIQFTELKQCDGVEAACTDDCEDPTDYDDISYPSVANTLMLNSTKVNSTLNVRYRAQRRDSGFTTQAVANGDLAFVSQPSGSSRTTYVYDNSAGANVQGYILESKYFDTTLSQFSTVTDSNGQTLQQRALKTSVSDTSTWSPLYVPTAQAHPTGMLSAFAGSTYGIARNFTPNLFSYNRGDGPSIVVTALDHILLDWQVESLVPNPDIAPLAVLSMSFGFNPNRLSPEMIKNWYNKLKELSDSGILLLCSAGNENTTPYKYPAKFGDPTSQYYLPNLIVVGSVDNTGTKGANSNFAPWVTVYAPGVDIERPYWIVPGTTEGTYDASGTSGATAKTAGLAAYLIGLSSLKSTLTSVAALKTQLITTYSWVRPSGLRCIYNGAP